MKDREAHRWTQSRLAARRLGLLSDDEAAGVERHLEGCADCRSVADAFVAEPDGESSAHLPAALIAEWPRAKRELRGLERALVRRHLERCAECRQDLDLLGYAPTLAPAPALEIGPTMGSAGEPAMPEPIGEAGVHGAGPRGLAEVPATTRVIRIVRSRPRWWDRALLTWSTLATAAAAVAIVVHLRRPVVEPPVEALMSQPVGGARGHASRDAGISLQFGPRPRSLKAPARGPEGGGKVNVIPVVGPVRSLALAVSPLHVPDTSLVLISLLDAGGDTLFTVRHRQWEFFPKRVLMIDGTEHPLEPGQYALVLASLIPAHGAALPLMSRYRFELRPR